MRKEGATESRLHRVHQKLSQIMNQAVDDGLIAKNPCSPISIPRPKPKERHSLTIDEAQRLNSIILGLPASAPHCAVLLALHTGMRRGEVLGLTWEHVHFDKRKLYVAQQYACDKVPRDPKSKKSKRWISLDSEIVAYLEEWKRTQRIELENRKRRLDREDTDAIAILQTEKSPVVTNVYGGYYDPNIFGRWFREFCVENGFGEQGRALGMPFSRHLDDGIFELRTAQGSDITRVLYFFVAGGEIVLTHGFVKKTQKTPAREIERAKRMREDWRSRNE